MKGLCKTHGETDFHKVNIRNYFRCSKCRSEAVQRRRSLLKKKAVEYKGSKCKSCGYNKCLTALTFHHINPSEKDFHLAQGGVTRAWEKIKKELDKCVLLCSNCHAEIHELLRGS